MEGMLENGARRMLDTGNWLVPYMYNELYTYKPPLAYWLGAIPLSMVDGLPAEWLFRLPFVSCAALLGLSVLIFIGRLTRPLCGLLCALATTGGVLLSEKVRLAEFDVVITLFVGLAVTLASIALASPRRRPLLWLAAYVALFLGLLAKGAPALLIFVPGLLVAAWFSGQLRRLFSWDHLSSVGLLVALMSVYVFGIINAVGWEGFALPAAEAQTRGLTWDLSSVGFIFVKPFLVMLLFAPFSVLLPRVFACCRGSAVSLESRLIRISAGFMIGGAVAFIVIPIIELRYFLPLAAPFGIACGLAAHKSLAKPASRFEVVTLRVLSVLILLYVPLSRVVYDGSFVAVFVLALLAVATLWVASRSTSARGWTVGIIVLISVFIAVNNGSVLIRYKAKTRDLSSVASQLDKVIPPDARICTNGPANTAGKYSSLFSYLERDTYTVNAADTDDVEWCVFWRADWRQRLADERFVLKSTLDHPYKTFYLVRRM